jgi:hypothetical protein
LPHIVRERAVFVHSKVTMGRFIRIRGLALKKKRGPRFFYWGFFIPFSDFTYKSSQGAMFKN